MVLASLFISASSILMYVSNLLSQCTTIILAQMPCITVSSNNVFNYSMLSTKAFLQPSSDAVLLFASFAIGCNHPPPPVPPFLLTWKLPPQGHCLKTSEAESFMVQICASMWISSVVSWRKGMAPSMPPNPYSLKFYLLKNYPELFLPSSPSLPLAPLCSLTHAALLDIPVYKSRVHSLHMLFSSTWNSRTRRYAKRGASRHVVRATQLLPILHSLLSSSVMCTSQYVILRYLFRESVAYPID